MAPIPELATHRTAVRAVVRREVPSGARIIHVGAPEPLPEPTLAPPRAASRPRWPAVATLLVLGAGAATAAMLHWEDRPASASASAAALAPIASPSTIHDPPSTRTRTRTRTRTPTPTRTRTPTPPAPDPAPAPAVAPATAHAGAAVPAAAPAPVPARARPNARRALPPKSELDSYLDRARRAYRARRYGAALALVDLAIGQERTPAAFRLLADILMARDEPAAALRAADHAIALAPDDAGGWLAKGMAHYELNQYAEARRALARNLALCPDCRDAASVRVLLDNL